MDNDIVISCEGVSKKFARNFKSSLWYGVQDMAEDILRLRGSEASARHDNLRKSEFWAVWDVSFAVKRGEAVGLIGHNGAGKTTLFKMINGLLKPDLGKISVRGRVGALIALGAGFNPILTGRENVFINAAVLGLSRYETLKKYDSIVEFAEIEEFMDAPVRTYSSGMQVRLGFAIAAHVHPEILLVDEILAVGDMAFRRKCHDYIRRLRTEYGTAIILCTHEFSYILTNCDRALVMDRGKMVKFGSSDEVVALAIELQSKVVKKDNFNYNDKNEAKAFIVDIQAKNPANDDKISSGDSFFIEIKIKSNQAIKDAFLGIQILSSDRSAVILADNSSLRNDFFEISTGEHTFSLQVPSLPFCYGKYFLRGFIGEKGVPTPHDYFGFENLPPEFVIDGNLQSPTQMIGSFYQSVLATDLSWQKK